MAKGHAAGLPEATRKLPNAQGLTPLFLGRAPPADGWGRRIYESTLTHKNVVKRQASLVTSLGFAQLILGSFWPKCGFRGLAYLLEGRVL